jgi:hypothetical protein
MKIKHYVFIAVVIFSLWVGWYFYNKAKNAKNLEPGIAGFKLKVQIRNVGDLILLFSDIASLSVPAEITVSIKNFSSSEYTVSQMKVDIFTESGQLLAGVDKPLSGSVKIIPADTTLIPIDYNLKLNALISLAQKASVNGSSGQEQAYNLLMNYVSSGKIGVNIVAKGFIVAEGIQINIDETILI